MDEKQKKRYSKLFRYKDSLGKKATKAEIKFQELLERYGISYRNQKGIFTRDPLSNKKRFRILDFYITRCRIGIEIDGGYHFTNYGKRRDAYRELELSKSRKSLIVWRFTNEEVFSESKEILERLQLLKEGQEKRMSNHREKLSNIDFLGEARTQDQEVIEAFKNKWGN